MKRILVIACLASLASCSSHGAVKFPGPDDDKAQVWNLNPGRWGGNTNDLIHEPTFDNQE